MRVGVEDRRWSSTSRVLSDRMIKGPGDIVCSLHHAQGDGFSWFGLKTGGYGSCALTSKPLAQVFRFGPQNRQLRFGDMAHKITATVS
jgi:hypothetical protein